MTRTAQLIRATFASTFGDPRRLLLIMAPLALFSFAASFVTPGLPPPESGPEEVRAYFETHSLVFIGTGLIKLILSLLTIVIWHRAVLLGERLAFPQAGTVFVYFGRLLTLLLVMLPIAIVASFVLEFAAVILSQIMPALTDALSAMLAIGIVVIGLRLSLILPATAIGTTLGLRAAWERTEGYSLALLLTAIATQILPLLLVILGFSLMGPVPVLGAVCFALQAGLSVVLGVSYLSQLYLITANKTDMP